MKFTLISAALLGALSASAAPAVSIATRDLGTDVGLFFGFIGGYGVQAGVDNQGGACSTPVAAARIPCSCPPDQGAFISTATANAQAGHVISGNGAGTPVSFAETGDNANDFTQRMFLFRDTMQGMGCPIIATNWAKLLPH
ncbi:hypothetical protein C8R46DRAFT_1024650 [Mycena filopes]|nr:hypothetical protein C8R46DRAFT_1024650 [Mycena filopes]